VIVNNHKVLKAIQVHTKLKAQKREFCLLGSGDEKTNVDAIAF
jgi:hypothetical protein